MTVRSRYRRLFALMIVSLIAASVLPACAPNPWAPPLALTIVHTNDTWGYLTPCG